MEILFLMARLRPNDPQQVQPTGHHSMTGYSSKQLTSSFDMLSCPQRRLTLSLASGRHPYLDTMIRHLSPTLLIYTIPLIPSKQVSLMARRYILHLTLLKQAGNLGSFLTSNTLVRNQRTHQSGCPRRTKCGIAILFKFLQISSPIKTLKTNGIQPHCVSTTALASAFGATLCPVIGPGNNV
jgi:hypothetical protein